MNQLARFVCQFTAARDAERVNLSEVERAALANLQSLLHRNPDELAAWLHERPVSAEEWLVLPPLVSNRPCF